MGQLCGDRAQVLGRPPQCYPNGATLVPSQQAHLCKPSPTVLVARLFQGCPGAIIPVKSSQGSSSATIPARPSQGCAAATIPARPSQCHCSKRRSQCCPREASPSRPCWCHSSEDSPSDASCSTIPAMPSWCHHNKADSDPYSRAIPVSPSQRGQSMLSW